MENTYHINVGGRDLGYEFNTSALEGATVLSFGMSADCAYTLWLQDEGTEELTALPLDYNSPQLVLAVHAALRENSGRADNLAVTYHDMMRDQEVSVIVNMTERLMPLPSDHQQEQGIVIPLPTGRSPALPACQHG